MVITPQEAAKTSGAEGHPEDPHNRICCHQSYPPDRARPLEHPPLACSRHTSTRSSSGHSSVVIRIGWLTRRSFRISPSKTFRHLRGLIGQRGSLVKRKIFTVVSAITLSSFILSSCDTPTGAGAGYGAAAGAIIGGAATGNVRAASIGAAAGAAAGALIGHAIQEDRVRAYGPGHRGDAACRLPPGVFSPHGRHDLR